MGDSPWPLPWPRESRGSADSGQKKPALFGKGRAGSARRLVANQLFEDLVHHHVLDFVTFVVTRNDPGLSRLDPRPTNAVGLTLEHLPLARSRTRPLCGEFGPAGGGHSSSPAAGSAASRSRRSWSCIPCVVPSPWCSGPCGWGPAPPLRSCHASPGGSLPESARRSPHDAP